MLLDMIVTLVFIVGLVILLLVLYGESVRCPRCGSKHLEYRGQTPFALLFDCVKCNRPFSVRKMQRDKEW